MAGGAVFNPNVLTIRAVFDSLICAAHSRERDIPRVSF
jgi:hypothetical protein